VFYSPFLFPKVAVTDPELTLSLPADLSKQMAMDAFVQGLEAYVSKAAHPFADMFAVKAMRLVIDNVGRIASHGDDVDARANVSLAGLLSVFAINQAGVGAVHALSNPLSGHYDLHHGQALSVLLAPVMEANIDFALERYAHVAELFGVDTSGMSEKRAASEAVKKVAEFVQDLGLKQNIGDFGARGSDLPLLVSEAHNPDMSTNPKELEDSAIESIYRQIL
jgi:alcohol dehydrogenase class IV